MSLHMSGDFITDIARGEVEGYTLLHKYGINPAVSSDAAVAVWSGNEAFKYATTGKVLYLSGSNVSDTTAVTVQGLDSDFALKTSTVYMNGQTAVKLVDSDSADISWFRVFRAWNAGSTDMSSDAYISDSDATLTGGVPGANEKYLKLDYLHQQTLMAVYTVPVNCELYLYHIGINCTANTPAAVSTTPHAAQVSLRTREPGGVFRTKETFTVITLGSNALDMTFPPRNPITAGTDVELYALYSTTTMGIDGRFWGILRDTSKA